MSRRRPHRPEPGPGQGPEQGPEQGPRPGPDHDPELPRTAPTGLRVAAVGAAVEGVALLAVGVFEAFAINPARLTLGITNAVFFVVYGVFLVWAARALWRVRPVARGVVLLTQLLQLGFAWGFRTGGTWPIAVLLACPALVVLVGLLRPSSIRAIEDARGG